MRLSNRVRLVAWGSCFAAACWSSGPSAIVAAEPIGMPTANAPHAPILDVALGKSGALTGQLVDAQGTARAGAVVRVSRDGEPVAATQTDAAGRFAISGMRGGVYQLQTEHGAALVRAWAMGTAPPSARTGLLVVEQSGVVRGQMPLMTALSSTPAIVALGAIAVAAPVGYQIQQQNRRSGS